MAPPDGRGQEMTSRLLKSMWSLQAGVEGTLFHVQSQQLWGFPGGAVIKNPPSMQETQEAWVLALGREDPLEEEMQPTPVFLPGESRGQRSLVGCSMGSHRVGGGPAAVMIPARGRSPA